MPTYDYRCESCGNRFEEWQKITDEPTKICPVCGGPVYRVIYPVGLVFKGGGFYKTDNRAAPPAESSATSAETAKESGAPSGAGTGSTASANGNDGKSAAPAHGGGEAASKSGDTAPAGAAPKSE